MRRLRLASILARATFVSPSSYVKDFHPPTLVIPRRTGFPVPYTQGLELFTALQLQKIPSRLLIFPDKGH